MKNKTLGTLALIGAPFLFLGLTYEQLIHSPEMGNTRLGGAYSFIYMAGWMCSLFGLIRIKATGTNWFAKGILWSNILTLALANVFNLSQLLLPQPLFQKVYWLLDPFWPISHVIMLVVGICVLTAKKLTGWKRFVPLAIGLWLPIALFTKLLPEGATLANNLITFYSAVAWSLLAIIIRTTGESIVTLKIKAAELHLA